MNLFPKVIIDVYPDYFDFSRGAQQIRMQNFVYLDPDHHTPIAIGEKLDIAEGVQVSLFDDTLDLPQDVDKFEYLKLYMSLAIKLLFINQFWPGFPPVFVFRGADRLKEKLLGYHRYILAEAARSIGVYKVIFE